jgi:hypothetical protein
LVKKSDDCLEYEFFISDRVEGNDNLKRSKNVLTLYDSDFALYFYKPDLSWLTEENVRELAKHPILRDILYKGLWAMGY